MSDEVSKLFRAYGLYNLLSFFNHTIYISMVSKLFRAYGLYNDDSNEDDLDEFEFQSSFELTGYITY